MSRSHRSILMAGVLCLLAVTVLANEARSERSIITLSHDFSVTPIEFGFFGTLFGEPFELPPGSRLVSFGYTDLQVEVYGSPGFSSQAGNAALGCLIETGEGVAQLLIFPFAGIEEGPGFFGPVSGHHTFEQTFPVDPFQFRASDIFGLFLDDPTGVFFDGVVYAEIEPGVVANDMISLSAVKALFR